MKLVIAEEGSDVAIATWDSSERVVAAAIGYVEMRAAISAASRAARLNRRQESRAWADIETVWEGVVEVEVDRQLLRRAGRMVHEQKLRAYDAVHLAALIESSLPADATFVCWDRSLRAAAVGLGYAVIPADWNAAGVPTVPADHPRIS